MIILFISSLFLNGHIFEIAKIIFGNFYHENLDTLILAIMSSYELQRHNSISDLFVNTR